MELLRAIYASGPSASKPTPFDAFLASHPAALEFVQTPRPVPTSFSKESFYAVGATKFTNKDGVARYGRYRILPDGADEYLDAAAAARQAPDFLFDEIRERVTRSAVKMRIVVQVAAAEDDVNDSTARWPNDRLQLDFGGIELTGVLPNSDAEQRHIIFDPDPRVDGIEPSEDPLFDVRSTLYLMSGRRRRSQVPSNR